MKKLLWVVGVAVALAALPLPVDAYPTTFSFSSGNRAASVTFDTLGYGYFVTLTNTSTFDVLVPTDVLTGVFFTLDSTPGDEPIATPPRVRAVLGPGSTVFYDPDGQPVGGVVGGEWAYRAGLVGAPGDMTVGISSSGLGLFGPSDNFPGPELAGPVSREVDGLQYGLLSAGDNPATGNAAITGSEGLIRNSVDFTLTCVPESSSCPGNVTAVWFQYGTALDEPSFQGFEGGGPGPEPVPEPGTMLLLGAGLTALAARRRR